MNREQLTGYVDDALKSLKDFQAASVEALYQRLYREDRPCMLLADEVGLGKTVVAKGLIAEVLKRRMAEGRRSPFKVTYICSNQVIAKENLRKLNLFPESVAMKPPVSRIAFLAYAEADEGEGAIYQKQLELNTLTPATSFQLTSGTGNKEERCIIYSGLLHDPEMQRRRNGLKWMLKGGVRNMETFKNQLDGWSEWYPLREGLPERFLSIVKTTSIPVEADVVYRELPELGEFSVYEAVLFIAERVNKRTLDRYWWACWDLSRRLRECLVEACLPYVDADLYIILDEFQRFRDLIDRESKEDHARLAQKVFEQGKNTRVLLLSATPFKAFTGYDDVDRGEDHYQDFRKVLRFLMRDDEARLNRYEVHRQALYRQILDLRSGEVASLTQVHREEVEQVLRSVMCRTERHSVAADPNALVTDIWKDPAQAIPFHAGDIENFRQTDRLARALARIDYSAGKPIEYCKSALYPLSFLDRYKLKEELRKHKDHPEISGILAQSKDGWLDLDRIDRYTATR